MNYLKISLLIIIIATIISACGNNEVKVSGQNNSLNNTTKQQEIEAENEKLKSEAEALKKELAEKEAEKVLQEQETLKIDQAKVTALNPEWNTSDVNAETNGNVQIALDLLSNSDPLSDGIEINIQKVYKTPWEYYGKPITFTGYAQIVDDYPPGSDSFLQSEIVMVTDDETIVDILGTVPSGDIKINDYVSITGLVVGRTEVDNTVGGTFTHLIVLTNNMD